MESNMTDDDSASPAPPRKPTKGNAKCKVCQHARRGEIEAAMARGIGKRKVGELFGLHCDSVQRHWQRHCPESVKLAHKVKWAAPKTDLAKLTLAEQEGVIVYLQRLRADLLTLFEQAKADGHFASVASISRELRGVLEMTAKITGELNHSNKASVVNITIDPEFLSFRARLLSILRRHPAAFEDVLAEFRAIESKAVEAMAPTLLIDAQAIEVPNDLSA
jgi:hypothetical protein